MNVTFTSQIGIPRRLCRAINTPHLAWRRLRQLITSSPHYMDSRPPRVARLHDQRKKSEQAPPHIIIVRTYVISPKTRLELRLAAYCVLQGILKPNSVIEMGRINLYATQPHLTLCWVWLGSIMGESTHFYDQIRFYDILEHIISSETIWVVSQHISLYKTIGGDQQVREPHRYLQPGSSRILLFRMMVRQDESRHCSK